ncbi:MAG: sulfatase [Candidatus Hodarchaeota archaeon]
MKKPNIVLFITHDQGQFLGCYNNPQTPNSLNTPNIDKIAKNGVKFTNYFCTAPQCSPSRGSIQTSLYPHQNGLMGLVDRGWTLPEHNKTLAMYLKENGYKTHLLGFQHESRNAFTLGYDTISKRGPEIQYSCKRMEKDYIKFIDEHKNDDKPFYVCIGAVEVHRPFRAWAEPIDPEIVKIPPYLPDHPMIRMDLAEFYGAIQTVDKIIGKILYHLEKNDLMENTLFIYTTDHGEAFPRAKCTLYDPGIKTLLLMSWQNSDIFTKGKVINQMISNIDLLPTLLDLIGSEIPKNIEGRSFMPILRDHNKPFRKEVYVEKTFHEIYDPMRGIRTENYKFILNFEKIKTPYQIPADFKRSSSWRYMKKIFNKPRSEEELYDLKKDPNEMINLRDDPNYKDILKELKQKLFNWMKITNDPILKGRIKYERKDYPKEHY